MFQIHCGKSGQLGPILVNFGIDEDLQTVFANGELSLEIVTKDLVDVVEHSHGLVGALTGGYLINPATPLQKVHTVAGMASIAMERELYFNLHTKGQTYFRDIRGQLYSVD